MSEGEMLEVEVDDDGKEEQNHFPLAGLCIFVFAQKDQYSEGLS